MPRGELDEGTTEPGGAFLYDQSDQSLTAISNPSPAAGDRFGFSVAAQAGNLIIGAPFAGAGGKVYIFDQSGNLLQTLENPQGGIPGESFGVTVTTIGTDFVLVSAVQDFDEVIPPTLAGRAYLFDLNGNFRQSYTNPTATVGDFFGVAAASFGANGFLVSSPGGDSNGTDSGRVFLFTFNTFEQWAAERIADFNQRGLTDDPGGNGVSNLISYAFGMPPLSPSLFGLPVIELLGDTLNVDHQRTPNTIDLIYTYEVSTDLLPDSWMAVDPVSLDVTPGDTEYEDAHVHIDLMPGTERLFFRLVVTQP